jgi:hypothetical protein
MSFVARFARSIAPPSPFPGLACAAALVASASLVAGCGAAPGDAATAAADAAKPFDGLAGLTAEQPFSSDPQSEALRRRGEGPFVERVVRFEPGAGAGFGAEAMPWVVLGGPRGEGDARGSIDVVSLGTRGSIDLAFEGRAVIDGPGADFIVFENAFRYGGARTFAEYGVVSVSEDGVRWNTFPCDVATGRGCAGASPVYANVDRNALVCTDPAAAGGDAFDLASVGLGRVRFVRIEDAATYPAAPSGGDGKAGFDLDAIAAIHLANP